MDTKDIYVLDTNAFFNILKYINEKNKDSQINESAEKLLREECYVSVITKIEIIRRNHG